MSIWSYLNDIELQTLRDAYGNMHDTEATLQKINAAKAEAENRLRVAKKAKRDMQAYSISKAIGDDMAPAEAPEVSVEELEFLIVGLEDRQVEQKHEIETQTHRYKARVNQCLRECIKRASETYRERTDALIASWRELNAAKLALGERDLSWIHMFIPALPGMPGGAESYGRACLFDRKESPLELCGTLDMDLKRLLG